MAGPVDAEEQAILDGVLQDPSYAGYATLWIGLSTTTPAEDGTNFTEPASANGYARVSTTGADWGPATGTAPATKSNTAVKTFPTATGSWGSCTHFGLLSASAGGSLKWWGALGTAKTPGTGDTASFAAAALVLKLGDPTDTY